jgi:hypothetical protein
MMTRTESELEDEGNEDEDEGDRDEDEDNLAERQKKLTNNKSNIMRHKKPGKRVEAEEDVFCGPSTSMIKNKAVTTKGKHRASAVSDYTISSHY